MGLAKAKIKTLKGQLKIKEIRREYYGFVGS
jgi:hypothetical protein